MKRLNIPLEDDRHAKFKSKCAESGKTMADVVTGLIDEWIGKPARSAHMVANPARDTGIFRSIHKTIKELRKSEHE